MSSTESRYQDLKHSKHLKMKLSALSKNSFRLRNCVNFSRELPNSPFKLSNKSYVNLVSVAPAND